MSDAHQAVKDAQPIVLIGRGGGGTRLLSQMTAGLGVFLGNELNVSFDSVEWVTPIYDIAIETCTAPAATGSPAAAQHLHTLRACAVDILAAGGQDPGGLWGWKLPETTVIVPQIAAAFPHARFVHLARHPVASCCRRSHMTSRANNRLGAAVLAAAYAYCGRPWSRHESDSVPLHNAISWAFQANIAVTALENSVAGERQLLLRYEDLCAEPDNAQHQIGAFIGLSSAEIEARLTPIDIDPARLNDQSDTHPEAAAVWDICAEQARRLGYQWHA